MSEAEKTRGSPHVPPYSSPDPPPPGLPSAQQLSPPQQTLAVQTQPPPPTGPQYYTQLAYPAPQVVLAQPQQPIVATQQGLSFDSPSPGLPSIQQSAPTQFPPQQPLAVQTQPPPLTGPQYYTQLAYPAPQVVLAPQQPIVATQQTLTRPAELSTKLPKYAFVTSVVGTFIFTALCWLPGLLCLVPATVMSIVALSKKEENKLKEAKHFSIISFVLVLIFAITYPILVTVVVLASVFGYICDYQYRERGYSSYSSYSSYRSCAR